jgi:hypothetical protein
MTTSALLPGRRTRLGGWEQYLRYGDAEREPIATYNGTNWYLE